MNLIHMIYKGKKLATKQKLETINRFYYALLKPLLVNIRDPHTYSLIKLTKIPVHG